MATNNIKKITTGILAGAIIVPCMTNEANASNTSLGINEGVVSTNEVVDTIVGQEVVLEKENDVIKGEASTDKDMNFAKDVVSAQGSITINDTSLKASIYTQLNKQISEELSDSDMKSLTSLTLTGKIESYEGLQAATNLKELVFKNVSSSTTVNYDAFRSLTGVTKLTYNGTALPQGFSQGINNLTNLTYLDLKNSDIDSLAHLSSLTKLEILNISNTKITDLSPLSNFKNLKELYFSSSSKGATSLEGVQHLTSLKKLDLTGQNGLSSYDQISKLTNLEELRLNEISKVSVSLKFLDPLTKIKVLEMNRVHPTSIDSLKNASALEKLIIKGDELKSIAALSDKKALKYLDLSSDCNGIKDLSVLKSSTDLEYLNIRDIYYQDLSSLSSLTKLNTLDLGTIVKGDNKKISLSFLKNMSALKELSIGGCALTGLDNLKGKTSLVNLTIQLALITDITPILECTNLQNLNLSYNKIKNISGIERLSNLKTLEVYGNCINDISPVSKLNNLSKLDFSVNDVLDVSSINTLKTKGVNIKGINNFEGFKNAIVFKKGEDLIIKNKYVTYDGSKLDTVLNLEFENKDVKLTKDAVSFNDEGDIVIKGLDLAKYNNVSLSLGSSKDSTFSVVLAFNLIDESVDIPKINTDKLIKVIKLGSKFDPLIGVTASNKKDGDLTSKIKVIKNTVDTSKEGTYTVTYEVTDKEGNTETETVDIVVSKDGAVQVESNSSADKDSNDKTSGSNGSNKNPVLGNPKTGDMGILPAVGVLLASMGIGALTLIKGKKIANLEEIIPDDEDIVK